MERTYLRDLGLNEENWPDTIYSKRPEEDERYNKYVETKELTGVWKPDCWNLDTTAMMWLYERLRVYKLDTMDNIDLTWHKYNFKGHEYNQLELVDDMIDLAEYVLGQPENVKDELSRNLLLNNPYRLIYNNFVKQYQQFEEHFKYDCSKRFWEIWSVVYPSMWW